MTTGAHRPSLRGPCEVTDRFVPGNPGRQPGGRNKVMRASEALLGSDAAALAEKAIELAMAGDPTALCLCLERLIPLARERPLDIDRLSDDPAAAITGDIIQAVADGDLLPSEGERLTGMVKAKAELTALREVEERLAALEAASAGGRNRLHLNLVHRQPLAHSRWPDLAVIAAKRFNAMA